MLLSVIIPFYHVEAYIGACLARAAELPAQDCELLLIDDCGTDGSAALAQAFAQTHANARVIRRAGNGGLSAARNTGLAEARGEYVYFLDSDDLPEPQALMTLVRHAKDAQLDVIKGRFAFFDDETGETSPGPAIPETGVMTGAALLAQHPRQLRLIGRAQHGHAGHLTQKAHVKFSLMGVAVVAHQPGAVNRKNNMQMHQRRVLQNHVKGALFFFG